MKEYCIIIRSLALVIFLHGMTAGPIYSLYRQKILWTSIEGCPFSGVPEAMLEKLSEASRPVFSDSIVETP